VPARDTAARVELLLAQLDLAGLEDRLVKTLSGGQRRRLDIGLGLVHSPRLIFLDEPTTGLDPQSRSNLWEHIRQLRQELGTTIFLTTHYLDEADALCDRVLVIDYGKIVAEGTPEELKRRISGDVITLSVSGDPGTAAGLLAGQPGVRDISLDGRALRLAVMVPLLLLLSGIMLPMTLGPGWLQGTARATPFRYITDAMREAYAGHYANTIMVEGIAVALGLAALCLWIASRVFVRENA
jgi:ABC transporter family protein